MLARIHDPGWIKYEKKRVLIMSYYEKFEKQVTN